MGPLDFQFTPEMLNQLKDQIEQAMQTTGSIQTEPEVKIIADSINYKGNRLTTFQLKFWRPILPELNRHRALSQSVRSSRAVPVSTIIEEIKKSPWGPREWGKKQRGMVAEETFTDPEHTKWLNATWFNAARAACDLAKAYDDAGVHQQIVNRILEPYSCTHAVVSATEWDNFFKLRCAPNAEPNFRWMAELMRDQLEDSTPKELPMFGWHLPYITDEEKANLLEEECRDISAARCARVSYKLFDGTTDVKQDLKLAHWLKAKRHMSPFEHVAASFYDKFHHESNFKGWIQYRKWIEYDMMY